MKAFVVAQHGGIEALELREVADPIVGAGEVVVRVCACGVNHLDLWVRRGLAGYRFPLPLIPGSDVAGVVHGVGPGVTHLRVGDEVIVAPGESCGHCEACLGGADQLCPEYAILGEHRDGGYAELLRVHAANIIAKPPSLSFAAAAALGVAFLTAWHMLVARARLEPGETVLIQAAGSGVGSAALQIAKLLGGRVIATAGGQEKTRRALELGAEHAIDYRTEDVARAVKAYTDGRGADVVFEHVGQATWAASLRALARAGRLVTCGATTGAEVEIDLKHLFFKSQTLLGSTMGSKGELHRIVRLAGRGQLQAVVDREVPLWRAGEAHAALEARELFGKVVLVA